ncbi:MAG: hypothetical protein IPH31_17605 [Lewinellaceae bacterium]|nr:hypothetical protein [Lewinellaceae bacterium]
MGRINVIVLPCRLLLPTLNYRLLISTVKQLSVLSSKKDVVANWQMPDRIGIVWRNVKRAINATISAKMRMEATSSVSEIKKSVVGLGKEFDVGLGWIIRPRKFAEGINCGKRVSRVA